jgi:hypothetical protein
MLAMSAVVPHTHTPEATASPRIRIAWLELTCLPCGEVAGYIEDGRIVRPVYPGGIRMERGRPRCGRCSGLLMGGERGVATTRGDIG